MVVVVVVDGAFYLRHLSRTVDPRVPDLQLIGFCRRYAGFVIEWEAPFCPWFAPVLSRCFYLPKMTVSRVPRQMESYNNSVSVRTLDAFWESARLKCHQI